MNRFSRAIALAALFVALSCEAGETMNDGGLGGDAIDVPARGLDSTTSDGASDRPSYRSPADHYCSSTESDDPFYVCADSAELVCISTHRQSIPMRGEVPIYLCRKACVPGDGTCPRDEICCPGPIFGPTYGKSHACVVPQDCDPNPTDAGHDN